MDAPTLSHIEIVEDRTATSRCDRGFLTLRRLVLQNRYGDGSTSEPYPCDVMERPGSDAVVCVLYDVRGGAARVLLREAARPPIYLRREKAFVHPDPREYTSILEVVAGLVEEVDAPGPEGIRSRGAIEAREEAGAIVDADALEVLGGETFASPGTTDEKIYFCAARVDDLDALPHVTPEGDGSVMEEWARLHVLGLDDALARCRDGRIPDMKTEVALGRLAAHLARGQEGAA